MADDVAPPKPARLPDQAKHQFATQGAKPARRARHRARCQVEQGADPDRHRAMGGRDVGGDPFLLAGRAERHQKDVGPPRLQLVEHRDRLRPVDEPVGERHIGVARIARRKRFHRFFRHAGPRAEQPHLERPVGGREQRGYEIGAVQIGPKEPSMQQERGEVDADPVAEDGEMAQDGSETGILERKIGVVRVQERDRCVKARVDAVEQMRHGAVARQVAHLHAEDIAPDRLDGVDLCGCDVCHVAAMCGALSAHLDLKHCVCVKPLDRFGPKRRVRGPPGQPSRRDPCPPAAPCGTRRHRHR